MRSIGLDIHRDFMEVAIAEGGEIRSCPRVAMDPDSLGLFAQSLGADDQVTLEVSGNAWEVVRLIRPHVGRIVAASPTDTGMRQARAKTDRLDARALARLLAAGQLETVWVPDEATQAMRRRLQRRSQLVRAKSAAKNEVHAALMRRLVPKPGFSDLFGKAGRRWLAELELPAAERESVDSAMRQIEFCEAEIAAIEKLVASESLGSEEIRRLVSVPGVGAITAAAFMAAVGDIERFSSAKKLVGYLGLDPIVRQSGSSEASYGRISKQGSAAGRYALVEASWSGSRRRGRCAPSMSAPRAGAAHRWRSSPPPKARLPVLGPAGPRRGLRLRTALAESPKAAPARAHRGGSQGPGRGGRLEGQRGGPQCRAQDGRAGRGRLPPKRRRVQARRGVAGQAAQGGREGTGRAAPKGRRRDIGARILKSPCWGQAARRAMPPAPLFSSSSTGARPRLCHSRCDRATRT